MTSPEYIHCFRPHLHLIMTLGKYKLIPALIIRGLNVRTGENVTPRLHVTIPVGPKYLPSFYALGCGKALVNELHELITGATVNMFGGADFEMTMSFLATITQRNEPWLEFEKELIPALLKLKEKKKHVYSF